MANRSANINGYQVQDIGFVETEQDAKFHFKMIAKTAGIRLNYESVDSCGKMGGNV